MISGLLVSSFPIVLGCDASGVVVEVGSEETTSKSSSSSSFKVGDRVCGCTRLGEPGYGTFQEYVWLALFLSFSFPLAFAKSKYLLKKIQLKF